MGPLEDTGISPSTIVAALVARSFIGCAIAPLFSAIVVCIPLLPFVFITSSTNRTCFTPIITSAAEAAVAGLSIKLMALRFRFN